jgi:hypothetical protein
MIFRGVAASSLGCIVRRMPQFSIASEKGVKAHVPGRAGTLFLPDGGYGDVYATSELLAPAENPQNEIRAWCGGEGDLILSSDSLKKRRVRASAKVSRFSAEYLLYRISWVGEPFRTERVPSEVGIFSPHTGFYGSDTLAGAPTFVLRGAGSVVLTLNGASVALSNLPEDIQVHIDCGSKAAYLSETNAPISVSLLHGAWPSTKAGANTLTYTGTVSEMTLYPGYRWL